MPGSALGQCRSWSLERATELESRLFMQQLQINIIFSTISLSVGSFRLIFY